MIYFSALAKPSARPFLDFTKDMLTAQSFFLYFWAISLIIMLFACFEMANSPL